jgi:hypothetical protein
VSDRREWEHGRGVRAAHRILDRLVDVTRGVLFGRIMPRSLLKMLDEHIAVYPAGA